MDIIEALKWRYAVKKFDVNKKLTPHQLHRISEGLNLTATSMGMQLMQFIVVESEKVIQALETACYNPIQLQTCSHVIVLCRKDEVKSDYLHEYVDRISATRDIPKDSLALQNFANMIDHARTMPREKQVNWLENQVYIALGNLLTLCAAEQIDSCPMEGFKRHEVDEILNLPAQNLKSVLLCPIGYRAEDDKYSKMPKVRKHINDLIQYV